LGSPSAGSKTASRYGSVDAFLVLMVLIWGANFSVLKRAFLEIPPQPFNALRLILAASVFLLGITIARRRLAAGLAVSPVFGNVHPVTRADWLSLVGLGIVGHALYQVGFAGGVALTSVANASLLIGCTPVVITVLSVALGRDRIAPLHWAGVLLSLFGIYVVVGLGSSFGHTTFKGDVLLIFSVICWAIYTVGASRLMRRHSPLFVTGMTMLFGAVPYVAWAAPATLAHDWASVSTGAWIAFLFATLLALNLSYLIWYMAVRQIGPARTAIYSNLTPLVAMTVAAIWLHEPISRTKVVGAAAVLSGVILTRLGRQAPPVEPELTAISPAQRS
jgi:drug/metabolite transporter (DMT)-like permease